MLDKLLDNRAVKLMRRGKFSMPLQLPLRSSMNDSLRWVR